MIVKALVFSLVPVLAAAASASVAVLRPPGEWTTSGLLHFAVWVVFAVASIELLPGVLRQSTVVAIAGFAVGIAVMFAFRAASEVAERRREEHGRTRLPIGLLSSTGVDFAIDGVILSGVC